MLNIIVAMTPERVIGNQGRIPWHVPEDLRLFRKLTTGNTVIMGRKTFESLPTKYRPLPNRNNIVVSHQTFLSQGVYHVKSIEEALAISESLGKPNFIIGGSSLYQQTLLLTSELYISHIKIDYPGDVFFPEINPNEWQLNHEQDFADFVFRIYRRS